MLQAPGRSVIFAHINLGRQLMSIKNIRGPGRPAVDSEALRFRDSREVIDAIEKFVSAEGKKLSRPDALRHIVRDWLRMRGYLQK